MGVLRRPSAEHEQRSHDDESGATATANDATMPTPAEPASMTAAGDEAQKQAAASHG